jgi:hypothetical protein
MKLSLLCVPNAVAAAVMVVATVAVVTAAAQATKILTAIENS